MTDTTLKVCLRITRLEIEKMGVHRERIYRQRDRGVLLCSLLPFVYMWVLLVSPVTAAQPAVQTVDAIGMTVSDVDRAVAFYSTVLAFEKVSEIEVFGAEYEHLEGIFGLRMKVARMKLGDEVIELTEYLTPKGQPIPSDSHSNDLWFQHIAIVVKDMETAYERLRAFKVQHVSTSPQTIPNWNQAAAGIQAFYFRDPDGHNLELMYFPPGKGKTKWQDSGSRLFLGIDHSAISVRDTETSLVFYRDVLGLTVMGDSVNHGTEQEHLANVFGARVHITGLRPQGEGSGIEFLEYLAPTTGRPFPPQARANDLLYWQTRLVVDNLQGIAERLRNGKYAFLSSGIVILPNRALGFTKGLLVRGPDGHAMMLVEK